MELHDGGRALLEAGGDVGVEARPEVEVADEQVAHGALHPAPEKEGKYYLSEESQKKRNNSSFPPKTQILLMPARAQLTGQNLLNSRLIG